jgi:hypothetical protein
MDTHQCTLCRNRKEVSDRSMPPEICAEQGHAILVPEILRMRPNSPIRCRFLVLMQNVPSGTRSSLGTLEFEHGPATSYSKPERPTPCWQVMRTRRHRYWQGTALVLSPGPGRIHLSDCVSLGWFILSLEFQARLIFWSPERKRATTIGKRVLVEDRTEKHETPSAFETLENRNDAYRYPRLYSTPFLLRISICSRRSEEGRNAMSKVDW